MTVPEPQSLPLSILSQEWNDIKSIEDRRETIVKTLFDRLSLADEEIQTLKDKFQLIEYAARQALEAQRQLTAEKDELQRRSDASPFVLVLIDGDSTQFNDDFVATGTDGGHRAAHGLKQALERFLVDKLGLPSTTSLVIRVYFNAVGLKTAYVNSGILSSGNILWDFVLGFNRELHLAEFIDAGQDKEAADYKIKANMDLFWRNNSCKHIILACSADQGYIGHLRQYSSKAEDRSRLTLIEATPFPHHFKQLSSQFQTEPFQELFRSTKLRPAEVPAIVPARSDSSWAATVAVNSLPPKSPKAVTAQPNKLSPKLSVSTAQRKIALNRDGQRIDKPLPQFNGDLIRTLQAKRLCLRHHLTRCTWVNCDYSHDGRLTDEERRVLFRIGRGTACSQGFDCRDRDCVLGHHCLFDERCNFGSTCKFPEKMHNVDKEVAEEV